MESRTTDRIEENHILVRGSKLPFSRTSHALNDFVTNNTGQLTEQDLREVRLIRQNPTYLIESYLFQRIEPYFLPFFEQED